MIRRLDINDWRVIGHYLGALTLLMAGLMFIPLIMALCLGEYESAVSFVLSAGITGICGAILLFCKVDRGNMSWRQALVIVGLAWLFLSFFGSIPLWFSNHYASFLDAFFEGVSALTASGLSLAVDLDHMAMSVNTWRFIMHLTGGIGVLVIAVALGVFGSGAGVAALYQAEGRSDHVLPEIKQTSRFIAKVSGVIIASGFVACAIPLLLKGMSPLRALINSFWVTSSAYATGGMTGQTSGIMFYHSWPLEIITLFLMFFGTINFLLYGDLWRGAIKSFFKDIEIRTLVIWIAILVVLMMFALMNNASYFRDSFSMLRRVLYLILAAATNTGFTTTYSGQVLYAMSSGAFFVVILAMMVGGSASSTTGGIKALRIGIIAKTMVQTVREALAPDRARPRTFFYHQGRQLLSPELASSAMTIFLLYIVTFAIGSVLGIAYGYDVLPSIFESVSAASNAGLSSGIVEPGMPIGLEVFYMAQMWLGRLEFIALFAMFIQIASSLFKGRKRENEGGGQ